MKISKKIVSLLLSTLLLAAPFVTVAANVSPSAQQVISDAATGTLNVDSLTVENHENPLGVDIAKPNLAWQIHSDGQNQSQSAYRILVASSQQKLDANEGDLWDTTVESNKNYCILYEGTPLQSRQRAYWKVMVWDANGKPSEWSASAWWEAALLNDSDWSAKWIGREARELPIKNIITNELTETTARYVRLNVNEVGPRASAEKINRLQIMEWEIYSSQNPGVNLAAGKKATATNAISQTGSWSASCLTDGNAQAGHGYSTNGLSGNDISAAPVTVTIDLETAQTFDTFKLYGRVDAISIDGAVCPNYPKQYDVEISENGTDWMPLSSVSVQTPPEISMKSTVLPLFAKEFSVDKEDVASARLYISGLGLYEAHINGQNVADTMFDPGETDYHDRVMYVTYDITDQLTDGVNAVGVELGNGNYNVGTTPGRYQKHNSSMGDDKLIAQIELTMKDGTVQTVASDASWLQTDGPITFSSWYGGEDYDATKEVAGWDRAGTDRSSWENAGEVDAPSGKLVARNNPPLRITEELPAVSIKKLDNGDYLVDFGRNFAGVYKMELDGLTAENRGTKMEFWPSELLNKDGTVNQGATGTPIWDSYTLKGEETESFQLKFMYHGAQYLQVKNSPVELTKENFTGYVVRTDNEKTGTFETSSDTINQINQIINVAVESNMYSVLTDCPHREKLGWLEVSHLMYYSMAYNFDIQSWMKKITLDMTDAQIENGMVPSIAPEFYLLSDGMRNDPTWGGASILDPWYTYQIYGDDSLLETAYPMMSQYIAYLQSQSKGGLLDFNLGDWGAYDTSTPVGLVVSATYYNLVDVMSQIADKLGRTDDAASYRTLAGEIKAAFNAKYFDPETGQYGSGSQASNACPLFAKLVPDEQIDRVLDNLVADIQNRDWHLSTGEVGLRQMFVVLAEYGRSDVVYKMATNKTNPSYWYFIENGRTSLPEYWDMHGSQNHCMMGHIQEWFYRYLAGIDHASPGFEQAVIKPFVPDDLESVSASTMTSYGKISSSWNHDLVSGAFTMNVEIPVGVTADVYVPAFGRSTTAVQVNGTTVEGTLEDDAIKFEGLGSGCYEFVREPANIASLELSADQKVLEIGELAEYAGIDKPAQLCVTARTDEGDTMPLSPKAVSMSSSDESVASVDPQTGLVTGHRSGSVKITAAKGGLSSTIDIQVRVCALTELSLKPSKDALNYVGDELWLQVNGTLETGKQIDLTGYDRVLMTSESPDVEIRPSGSVKLVSRGTVGEQLRFDAAYQDVKAAGTVLNGSAQNLARAEGTTLRASSAAKAEQGAYCPESAANGDRTGNQWGKQGGWSDGTNKVWPDWYQVDFNEKKTISAIDLTFLQDNYKQAAAPTLETVCTKYPVDKFTVEYWDGTDWNLIENGSIVENNKAWVQIGFAPVNTNRVRVLYSDPVGDFARLVEIEVWEAANPADNSLPAQLNGTQRSDLFSYTLENGTCSIVPDSEAILEAAGNSAEILVKAPGQANRMTLEFEPAFLEALKDRAVSFTLDNGSAALTATAAELYQQDKLNQASSITSKPVVLFTLETGMKVTGTALYTNFDKSVTASIDPVVQSDKSILKAVLDYAQAAIDNGETEKLIPSVREQFDNAFGHAKAVYRNTASTQQEVDSAWISLMNEIHKLGFIAGDKGELNKLVDNSASLDLSFYADGAAKDAFAAALAAAQKVSADCDALTDEVATAQDTLLDALLKLRFKADKSILEQVLAQADSIDTSAYTAERVVSFNRTKAEAETVYVDTTLSTEDQGTVEAAAAALRGAIDELKILGAPMEDGTVKGDFTRTAVSGNAKTGETIPVAIVTACIALMGAGLLLSKKKR